jgi:mono/diheme cytochrome c family protein
MSMTRQSRARWLAFATALLVVLLAALFAWLRNLTPAPAVPQDIETGPGQPGRAAFARACASCHSAEGRGNPAIPLDSVGARLDRNALRELAFGTSERLPASVAAMKRAGAQGVDAEAVLDYLQQLR